MTIVVTGASGYIAKHILVRLLNRGHTVRGSVRRLEKGDAVRAAIAPHLDDPAALDRLSFVELDLARDPGWPEAMQDAQALMHTASPFPLTQPKDENEVIRPAVDGALRALKAARAAGVTRVILTSSTVAVTGATLPDGRRAFDERDWSDLSSKAMTAYGKSKTLAEQAAWDFVRSEAPEMRLTAINPGFVLGAPLDGDFGTSIQVVQRILRAKDPMLPNFGFSSVDVGDVAEMHVRALQTEESVGQRILGVSDFLWFPDMAKILKDAFPDRRIVTRRAPNAIVRMLALFDPAVRSVVPLLDIETDVANRRAREVLGLDFRDPRDSLRETADWLIREGLV